ncbi:phage tail assembly protein [Paracoccaceae bacterium GXU_MW_L88]
MNNTYKLRYPVMDGDQEIKEINFRRPNAADIKRAQKNDTDAGQTASLLVDCAEIPPSVVDQFDIYDFVQLGNKMGEFTKG